MDEMTMLRRIGAETQTDPDALARLRAAVVTREQENAPTHAPVVELATQRSRRRFVRFAVAATMVGVLGVGGVVAATWSPDENPPAASASAAELLSRAADASLRTSDPALGPTQYRKVTTVALWSTQSVGQHNQVAAWLDKETITTWVPADASRDWVMQRTGREPYKALNELGAGAMKESDNNLEAETRRAKNGEFYANEDAPAGAGAVEPSWGNPTPAWLASLPRDVTALHAKLAADARGAGSSQTSQEFVLITDVLRSGIVPADLRAALYRVAATKVPGIELVDKSANLEGSTGVAVGLDDGTGQRHEMVFDATTGQVIGERSTQTQAMGGIPAGAVVTLTAVNTQVVDSAP